MWVPTADLPKSAGHPSCERLNRVLDEAGFDAFVEAQCASFYADGVGRPSLAPGRYFRLLLGYFEGLDSERAIAWRAADSLSIRTFLDFALHEAPPDPQEEGFELDVVDREGRTGDTVLHKRPPERTDRGMVIRLEHQLHPRKSEVPSVGRLRRRWPGEFSSFSCPFIC